MAVTRTATTTWSGTLISGEGAVSLDTSGQGSFDVTWKARTEEADRKTSPEELIAAAHSSCFSMALSHGLGEAGFAPEKIQTSADVTLEPGTGITTSVLTVTAKVPGIEEDQFQSIAEEAKNGCPVSQALAGVTTELKATLEPSARES